VLPPKEPAYRYKKQGANRLNRDKKIIDQNQQKNNFRLKK
jgi:hypothetical protein